MRKIILAVCVAFSLGGCAALDTAQRAYTAATETQVPASYVLAAGNSFVLLETAGTSYLLFCKANLNDPKCSAGNRRFVIANTRKGRAALNQLKVVIASSSTASASVYNVLIAAVTGLQSSPVAGFGGQ